MKKIFIYESKSVILENTLYNERMMTALFNKYKDKSEDTIKKINIAALFRTYFGNIHDKDKQYLDTKYEQWYKDTVNTLTKTSIFFDNENAAKKYLDAYINNIGSLGKKAAPFNLKKEKSIEKYLLDVVNNNRWLPDDEYKKANVNFTKDELGDDLIYEDKNIIIVDGSTQEKCVKYGRGETWCISTPSGTMYHKYRYEDEMSFYFVLQKNVGYPEHKLIISNMGNGYYSIADQTNVDDRGGTYAEEWSSIERQIPNLRGKKKYFKYKEITEQEKEYNNIINSFSYDSSYSIQGKANSLFNKLPQPNNYTVHNVFASLISKMNERGKLLTKDNLEGISDENMNYLISIPYIFNKDIVLNVLTKSQRRKYYRRLIATGNINFYYYELNDKDMLIDMFINSDLKSEYMSEIMSEIFYEHRNDPEVLEKIRDYHKIITNSYIIQHYIKEDKKGDFIKFLFDNDVLMVDHNIIKILRENNFSEKVVNELLENFVDKLATGELSNYLKQINLYTYTSLYPFYIELLDKGVDVNKLPYKKVNIDELNFINMKFLSDVNIRKPEYINFLMFLVNKRICNIKLSSFFSPNNLNINKEIFNPLINLLVYEITNITDDYKKYFIEKEKTDEKIAEFLQNKYFT